jgi:hypothetical protein
LPCLAFAALTAAGCYSPDLVECTITCAADGSCPSGTQCLRDNFCHVDPAFDCRGAAGDAGVGVHPDARPGAVDARPTPDAPPICPAATVGEPDNSCPGERTPTLREGLSAVFSGRAIAPGSDVDVYEVPLELQPVTGCQAGHHIDYAVIVALASEDNDVRLRRFPSGLQCGGSSENGSTSFCEPFTETCGTTPASLAYHFRVEGGGGPSTCSPYTVTVRLCAAGSSCTSCR